MSGSIGASSWRRSRGSRSMTASCAKAPGTPSATWPSWATACTSCWPGTMRRGGTGGRASWGAWRARHEGAPESAIAAALRGSAAGAREALAAFGRFLEEDVRPRAEGEGRLGTELFAAKLRHTLSSDLPHERLRERARRDHTAVRGELVRRARGLWPNAR